MTIQKKKLANGLQVILIPQKDAVTATMLTLIGVGSNMENAKQNGISHFLEHVCFKGTEKRPTAKIINQEIEQIGAIANAFTGEEYTGFYAKSHPRHVHTIIDIIGDIVLNSTIPENEVEKEKGVIVEEINMYEDMPQAKVMELLTSIAYGDTPAGRGIIGTKESVRALTQKDILKYKKNHYVSENMVVVVAGAFDEKEVLSTLKTVFKNIPNGKKTVHPKVSLTTKTPQSKIEQRKIDQAHLAIMFPSVSRDHKAKAAATLLAKVLGGSMSSRLFQLLREELGVCYYVRASQSSAKTYGEFCISAGVDARRVDEVCIAIATELKKIKEGDITDEELSRAKEYMLGVFGMSLETTDSVASFYGMQALLSEKVESPEKITKQYLAVTVGDIQRVAKKLIDGKKVKVALVGPISEETNIAQHFSLL